MPDIVHKVNINAGIKKVYDAVATVEGLKGWWTTFIEGESQEGEKLFFRFPETGPVMEVMELLENEFIKWKCIDCVEEWKETILTFELEENDGATEVLFAHSGWEEESGLFAHCNTKWAMFMLSLKLYCETGKGQAFPDDVKI